MWGLDLLAAAKYQRVALKELPEGWALGLFADTFGDSREIARKALEAGHVVRVHLMWKDYHEFGSAEITAAVKEAKKWRALSDKFGSSLRVSPWCEHRAKKDVLTKLHKAIMKELPACLYVNTPIPGGDYLRGVINETHHGMKALSEPYMFSFDGVDCFDADTQGFKDAHANADIFFFWTSRFNGKWEAKDTTPRPRRKGWPDSKLIKSVVAMAQQRNIEAKLPFLDRMNGGISKMVTKGKGALSSLTIWGNLASLGGLLAIVQEIEPHISAAIAAVGALVSIFGRFRANTKINGIV